MIQYLHTIKIDENKPAKDAAGKDIAAKQTDANVSISDEDIRKRAHGLFLERGDLYVPPDDDWLKAETELRNAA
ncbi:MAG: DUF2934 domain-containing protein [Bacteroidales bacterium]